MVVGTVLAVRHGVKKRARSRRPPRIVNDPVESARLAGLRYVSETGPGIRRRRAGRGFVYLNGHGPIREEPTLALFRQWEEEDAKMTPEEAAAEDELWERFQVNVNETRRALGMREL